MLDNSCQEPDLCNKGSTQPAVAIILPLFDLYFKGIKSI